jgi:hypothetical protein
VNSFADGRADVGGPFCSARNPINDADRATGKALLKDYEASAGIFQKRMKQLFPVWSEYGFALIKRGCRASLEPPPHPQNLILPSDTPWPFFRPFESKSGHQLTSWTSAISP